MSKATVLVVDDEEVMRQTLCRGLKLCGYRCVPAANSTEAIQCLDGPKGNAIDLMLTDLSMPGKSGLELIDQVRQLRPDLPVIVITGLTFSPEVEVILERGIPLLHKPFNPGQLERAICTQLDRRARQERSTVAATTAR